MQHPVIDFYIRNKETKLRDNRLRHSREIGLEKHKLKLKDKKHAREINLEKEKINKTLFDFNKITK